MDWQEIVFDEICAVRGNPATIDNPVFEAITKEPPKPMVLPAPSTVKNTLYIIIDTNIFLHDLPFVRDLVDNQDQKGMINGHTATQSEYANINFCCFWHACVRV